MRNKFAGTCGCGKRLAAGRGLLCRVGEEWAVRCATCPEGAVPARAKPARKAGKRSGKPARPRKSARSRSPAPARGKPWGKVRRKATASRGKRRAWGKDSGRRGTPAMAPAAVDWSLHFTPIRYGATVPGPDGQPRQCTAEYASLVAEAAATRDPGRELDLLVTLVELRALGHLAEAA